MSLQLNPLKAARNSFKAAAMTGLGIELVRTQYRSFKKLATLHPAQAVGEQFKGIGRQFQHVGTVLSLGTYKGAVDKG